MKTQNQHGVILVTTLGVLGLLTFLVLNLGFRIRMFLSLADYRADEITTEALLQAGLARGLWAIRQDQNLQVDYAGESWGSATQLETELLPAEWRNPDYPTVRLGIIDEESKLNVNMISPVVLQALLQKYYPSEIPVEQIAAYIIDWLDADGNGPAETDYYAVLPHPYHPRNGKIRYLEELRCIRVISQSLFFGEEYSKFGISNETENQSAAADPRSDSLPQGLRDLLTIHTEGYVNVNTVPSPTLEALLRAVAAPDQAQLFVQEIDRARTGTDGILGTADDTPFQTLTDLTRIIGATVYQQAKRVGAPLGITSNMFSISVSVDLVKLNLFRNCRGLVQRKDGKVRLVYWREESPAS